jgi:hypothetical protein
VRLLEMGNLSWHTFIEASVAEDVVVAIEELPV